MYFSHLKHFTTKLFQFLITNLRMLFNSVVINCGTSHFLKKICLYASLYKACILGPWTAQYLFCCSGGGRFELYLCDLGSHCVCACGQPRGYGSKGGLWAQPWLRHYLDPGQALDKPWHVATGYRDQFVRR